MSLREGFRELTVEELSEVSGGKSLFGWFAGQVATYAAGQLASSIASNISSGNTPDYSRVDPMGNAY